MPSLIDLAGGESIGAAVAVPMDAAAGVPATGADGARSGSRSGSAVGFGAGAAASGADARDALAGRSRPTGAS